MNKSFCNECREVQPYKVDAAGEWFCRTCGFAIECVECGLTMHADHECPNPAGPSEVITCKRCGKTTHDPDLWDPEAGTGDIYCDRCWDNRDGDITFPDSSIDGMYAP